MKKILSYILDGFIVIIVGLLAYVAISMMISKNQKGSYGIPSAFGKSFLYIATDSMDTEENDHRYGPGTGIIISKVTDIESLKVSNPIYKMNEDGTYALDENGEKIITGVDKTGDIVTFYWEHFKTQDGREIPAPDTHRLIDKYQDETGLWHFETKGDRDDISRSPYYAKEEWDETKLIGKVEFDSKFLGTLLVIASPSVAATVGKTAWLFPLAIITPIILIALGVAISNVKKYRLENSAREEIILEEILKSNVDLNDDVAVETVRARAEVKLDLKEEFARLKDQIRAEYQKAKEKEKKNQ